MSYESKTVQVNGQTVQYLEAGSPRAKAVILLHGGMGNAAFHWARMIPELAFEFHVIAPDLPAFGKSDPLPNMRYDALLDWLDGFYAALDLEAAALVGTSFGGLIARLYAAQHPVKVPALVLINGGVLPSKPTGAAKFMANLPILNNILFQNFAKQGIGGRQQLAWVVNDPNDTEVLTESMVSAAVNSVPALATVMRMQVLDKLPEKRVPGCPSMLIWGKNDEVSPLKAAHRVEKAIAASQVIEVDECKHAPHIQAPDVLAFQIQQFLENLGAPPKADLPGVGFLG